MKHLFKHYFKQKVRTWFWKKNVLSLIFTIIGGLYFLLIALSVGILADVFLNELAPDKEPTRLFLKYVFIYHLIDILIRFKFQEIAILNPEPYRTLPIPKRKLYSFPMITSHFSFFNLLALIILLPFTITNIWVKIGPLQTILWWVFLFSVVLTINYLSVTLKLFMRKYTVWGYVLYFVILGYIALEITGVLNVSDAYASMFLFVIQYPFLLLIPIGLAILSYRLGVSFLLKNRYNGVSTKKSVKIVNYSFLERFGEVGQFLKIELKFIFRNKKVKAMFISSIIFIGVGMNFYLQFNANSFKNVFSGIFVISMFSLNFSQIIFAGISSHFDGFTTMSINIRIWLRSKYLICVLTSTLSLVLSTVYFFFDPRIPLFNIALYLFVIGVIVPLLMYLSLFNYKPFNVVENKSFDFKSVDWKSFIPLVVMLGFPFCIYGICYLFGNVFMLYYILAGLGIIGLATNGYWMKQIALKFQSQKHKLAQGFRQG
jgi:hypothetical protein